MGGHEIYTREYYQQIFDLENRHWWHTGMRQVAAALLRAEGGKPHYRRVMDAGCGTGAGMVWARQMLHADTVIGADISEDALQFCRTRLRQVPGLDQAALQASVLQLPIRSESCDLVLCWNVLQHLPTDGGDCCALEEMYRVLRPGGLLLIHTNSRLGMWQDETARDVDFQRYIRPEIVARLQAAGFVVLRATYANALPSLYTSFQRWVRLHTRANRANRANRAATVRERHQRQVYEGMCLRDTAALYPWLNRLLLGIIKAEAAYLSATGRSLAFGHSIFCVGSRPKG